MSVVSHLFRKSASASWTSGRHGLSFIPGCLHGHPKASILVVPVATLVIPRNKMPTHWTGNMQICEKPRADRPIRWNYKQYGINHMLHRHIDATSDRLDEYSRIIVVDGNIGSGKSTVAKEIARKFDLLYIPEPNCHLRNSGSYPVCMDLRNSSFQKELHPLNRKYDLKDFYTDPGKKPYRAAHLQMEFYRWRYHQYADACLHLMSTGQGVVLERSIYSDHVFAETLYEQGLINRRIYNWYNYYKTHTICNFWKPHLVVYLDAPVEVCMERIQKRGIDYEVNSKLLNEDYLATIEKHYKTNFLPLMEKTGELIVSEHPDYDDPDMVIEEITRLDFSYDIQDQVKFGQWRKTSDKLAFEYRFSCANEDFIDNALDLYGVHRVPELWKDPQLIQDFKTVYNEHNPHSYYELPYGVRQFRFLDNIPTPVLGEKYKTIKTKYENPLADAAI